MRRTWLSLLLLPPIAVVLVAAMSGSAGAQRARAASGRQFTAKLSYNETNHGRAKGTATVGIQGRGSYSVRLRAGAALEAAFITLATGVPVTKIAQGGSYTVQRDIAGSGDITGLAVVKFKAHGLGVACLSYTAKPGKFVPGDTFVPMSGSIKVVGGSGAATHWHGSVKFNQTGVTGSTVEQLGANGSEQASIGSARHMTTACKRVAALR
jgi:hypothetical protein